ncbi:efflux transporter outer membrane subunit [Legionella maioricensis]|uniref:Efflux transporter outer membrane subunit n=1 Tax=Legionella maioricensis TaxID=2896528 RepID=A0A9X2D221_9GAMM|nr:efflux transporter outer membrane subunit [Legionella maioricensis]MCL9685046.1 efflux transporter outer membrane subunit [Legionella maioricensis]MCL9688193.1 efflux transporter outer membrane subunit [Legionella maioricensis]
MDAFYSKINAAIIIGLCAISSACMVGPNFRSPPPPQVERYTETPLPKKTVRSQSAGGNEQTFVTNEDIPIIWWELFHSQSINQLIQAGLANNPSLASAIAALRQAQENVKVQIGNTLWPAFNTTNYAERQRYSFTSIASGDEAVTFNLYNVTANVSYTLDAFGGSRRAIESLRAQADYQQFLLIGAYLTLTSNIVTTAISVASYQDQIDATLELIKVEEVVLDILNKQYRLGGISNADVLTQQTTLEQTKASLPPLQKNLSLAKHSLSALVGKFPDGPLPKIDLNSLRLPSNIPVSLPSNLVRQRPDVRAAEATLHAACAQIGVATANLLPQFTLTGSYGWLNTSLTNLFTPQNVVWNIIGQVAQPLFKGGALFAARRAKIAAYQQADAEYRKTVLQAFQNVADSLRALETDARTLQAQALAEKAARQALNLTLSQYRLGATNYINLLNAQHQYQQTRINRIQAQAARYSDTVALFQSLGGGWWHKPWCTEQCG